jgi:hypothetical protein
MGGQLALLKCRHPMARLNHTHLAPLRRTARTTPSRTSPPSTRTLGPPSQNEHRVGAARCAVRAAWRRVDSGQSFSGKPRLPAPTAGRAHVAPAAPARSGATRSRSRRRAREALGQRRLPMEVADLLPLWPVRPSWLACSWLLLPGDSFPARRAVGPRWADHVVVRVP